MMSLSFPTAPTNGQQYQNWVWSSTTNSWNPNYAAGFVTSFNGRAGPVTMQTTDNTVGNKVLISSQTVALAAPVASVGFFYNFTNLYDEYFFSCYGVQMDASGGMTGLQVSLDGSSWLSGTNYEYAHVYPQASGPGAIGGAVGATYIPVGINTAAAGNAAVAANIEVALKVPWTTDRYKYMLYKAECHPAAGSTSGYGHGTVVAIQQLKGVRFFPNAGNFTRGVFNLYGIVKSGAGIS